MLLIVSMTKPTPNEISNASYYILVPFSINM